MKWKLPGDRQGITSHTKARQGHSHNVSIYPGLFLLPATIYVGWHKFRCFAMLNNSHLFIERSAKGEGKKTKVLFFFQGEINKSVAIAIVLQSIK